MLSKAFDLIELIIERTLGIWCVPFVAYDLRSREIEFDSQVDANRLVVVFDPFCVL